MIIASALLSLSAGLALSAEMGEVIKRYGGCSYFVADGPRGLYVLEWFGGYDPDEGDRIYGDIGSYGMKEVYYPDSDRTGKVWVEDFLGSSDRDWETTLKRRAL